MSDGNLLDALIEAFKVLPGVGAKTAQRMAFHLLERNRQGATVLAGCLTEAIERIGHCTRCRTFTEHDLCHICNNTGRDASLLCVVESPADVMAIERIGEFRGQYYVLMGRLSPLDGVGPKELGLDRLESRLDEGEVQELILATNATVEGEVTAHVLSEMARKRSITSTRLAQGLPSGGELEYMDGPTLSHAFSGRRSY